MALGDADLAEIDDAVTEFELCVNDATRCVLDLHVLLEAEGRSEEVEGGLALVVTEGGDDGRAPIVLLGGHQSLPL